MTQSFAGAVGPSFSERVDTAQHYWRWTRPKRLEAWDESIVPNVLEQFDRLNIPSTTPDVQSDNENSEYLSIAEFRSIGASAYTMTTLFAETLGITMGNCYPSLSEDRIDEQLLQIMPRFAGQFFVTSISPVDVLCNIGIDFNIAKTLQNAYYSCRTLFFNTTPDPLDLTVLLSVGFMVDRWSWAGIRPDAVLKTLVDREPIEQL